MTVERAAPLAGEATDRRVRSARRPRFWLDGVLFGGVSQLFLLIWSVLVIFPLAWMVMTAFKTDQQILFSPWALPVSLEWDSFVRAWDKASIGQYFVNSLIVVAESLTLTLIFSSMAAYVLARYEFPGNRLIYYAFLMGLTFPVWLAVVPLFF